MKSQAISVLLMLSSLFLLPSIHAQNDILIKDWLGEWKGELIIESGSKARQKVEMRIQHFETDSVGIYGWFLIYGDDPKTGLREYYLKAEDPSIGHYVLDEKNGIFLDTYMLGNKMLSSFDVEGSLITSVYTLEENGDMIFEIFFASSKLPNVSGGEDDIPIVKSYQIGGYQRAVLKKISK